MSHVLQVFFEETEEHLATLELLLIGLDLDRPDSADAARNLPRRAFDQGFQRDVLVSTTSPPSPTNWGLLDRIRCGQMYLGRT